MKNILNNNRNRKIGILGGMGPQASSELVRLIVAKAVKRGAREPNEFPEIVLDSIPVEDFIASTEKIGIVERMLVDRAKLLKSFGCNPIVMACNTAHIMEFPIKKVIPREFRSLLEIMGKEVCRRKMKKVCVYASPVTIENDLYGKTFRSMGISVFYPDRRIQVIQERIIRNVISGRLKKSDRNGILQLAARNLRSGQADGVILGCTELPVVTGEVKNPKILSSLEVLADNLLTSYYNKEEI